MRRIISLLLSVTAAISLTGCGKSYWYNYRITVNVTANGQTHTASSVVRIIEAPSRNGGMAATRVCGEATVVDLGGGKVLVATLQGRVPPDFSTNHPHPFWQGGPTLLLLSRLGLPTEWIRDDGGIKQLPNLHQSFILKTDEYPELVAFKNKGDPTTVEKVDPDNLDAISFDSKIETIEVVIQSTSDDITSGNLKAHFPWFNSSNNFIDGRRMSFASYPSYYLYRCSRFTDYGNF